MQMRTRSWPARVAVIALAIGAGMAAAARPAAAADPSYTGWFIALDAAMTQPSGLDQHYATAYDTTTGAQEFLFIDNDTAVSGEARIGYSWGELGGLALAYWSFDSDDDLSAVDNTRYIYPTVFGGYAKNYRGNFGLGCVPTPTGDCVPSLPVQYAAGSSVKADSVDLEYLRPMEAGERVVITWIAGLRSVTFEEDQAFYGSDINGYFFDQTRHMESDAYGIKVGGVFDFGLTEHFGLQARMAFSFLQGDNQAVTTQRASGEIIVDALDSLAVENDNIRGEIRDYDLRAVWSWKSVDVYFGYGGSTWDGLVKDPTGDLTNGFATTSDGNDRESVSFGGMHAGVVFRLGGG